MTFIEFSPSRSRISAVGGGGRGCPLACCCSFEYLCATFLDENAVIRFLVRSSHAVIMDVIAMLSCKLPCRPCARSLRPDRVRCVVNQTLQAQPLELFPMPAPVIFPNGEVSDPQRTMLAGAEALGQNQSLSLVTMTPGQHRRSSCHVHLLPQRLGPLSTPLSSSWKR